MMSNTSMNEAESVLFIYLHDDHDVKHQYERSQEGSGQLIGWKEVVVQLVPADVVRGDGEDDDERRNQGDDPEQNDSVVPAHPPRPDAHGPAWVEFLLQHHVRHLKRHVTQSCTCKTTH